MFENRKIQAIIVDDEIAKVSILEVPDQPGIAFKLFSAIAENDIKIDSIVQNINRNNINDISFIVPIEQAEIAQNISNSFSNEVGASKVIFDKSVAKISVIGSGVIINSSTASKFFKALYEIGVNIQMISTSEIKISCIIDKYNVKSAMKQIYKEFQIQ